MVSAPEGSNQVPFFEKGGIQTGKSTLKLDGNSDSIKKIWKKFEKFRLNLKIF